MKKIDNTRKIISNIERGYDNISDKFSNTRKYFWAGFEFILENIENGDKILDFGCGNGRLLEILKNKEIKYFGVDVSQKLIDIAKQKYQGEEIEFQKISGLESLPLSDNFFNKVISISVFHHFPKKYAEEMAKELYRITKPEGIVMISVWNLWQKKYLKYFVKNLLLFKFINSRDIFIPFKDNQGKIFNRFHHMFFEKELVNIFEKAGFRTQKSFILNKRNIVFIGRKI